MIKLNLLKEPNYTTQKNDLGKLSYHEDHRAVVFP